MRSVYFQMMTLCWTGPLRNLGRFQYTSRRRKLLFRSTDSRLGEEKPRIGGAPIWNMAVGVRGEFTFVFKYRPMGEPSLLVVKFAALTVPLLQTSWSPTVSLPGEPTKLERTLLRRGPPLHYKKLGYRLINASGLR